MHYQINCIPSGGFLSKQSADVEETDLLHLKPTMGRFLENPAHFESYENSVTMPKSSVGEYIRNDEEKEAENEESLNDLLKTVLITLRDHPDIIMDILQGNCTAFLLIYKYILNNFHDVANHNDLYFKLSAEIYLFYFPPVI